MSTGPNKPSISSAGAIAHIGSSVSIKGELSGSEDLYFDGEVEGPIDLGDSVLTIGAHGRVRSRIYAKVVIVQGKVEGDISADFKVELRRSAVVAGNIKAQRLIIEDGALLQGKVEMVPMSQPEKSESRKPDTAATFSPSVPALRTAAATPGPQSETA